MELDDQNFPNSRHLRAFTKLDICPTTGYTRGYNTAGPSGLSFSGQGPSGLSGSNIKLKQSPKPNFAPVRKQSTLLSHYLPIK